MIHATLEGDLLRLVAGPRDVDRIRMLPGHRAHAREDPPTWTCPASLYHAVLLRNLFGEDFTYGEDVHDWALDERDRESLRRNPFLSEPTAAHPDLYEFQRKGVARFELESCILGDETGIGKTPQALATLGVTQAFPALVVTTRTMRRVWAREAARWCPDAVPYVIAGTPKQRAELFAAAQADPRALVIVGWAVLAKHSRVAGYGGVSLKEGQKDEKELNAFGFRTVIADEAHRAKDPHAAQTRALWWLADRAEYVYPLTATPYANHYADTWSLLRLVCPRAFPNRGDFIDRYVMQFQRPWGWEPICLREETKAELLWWLDQYIVRRVPEEVPELESIPKVREVRVDIELTPKQRTAYKAFKKEAMAMFDGELLIATDPLTKAGRLRYIASACPVVEDGQVTGLTMPSNKVDAMLELFEDGALPAVVFAESSKLIGLAYDEAKRKGYRVGKITGAENDRQRELAIDDFQAGKLDAMFCTAAGGEGVTLSRGKSTIFLQLPPSLVQYRQMKGRVPRIGNERDVVMEYQLVSEGTNDEAYYEIVVTKTAKMEEVVRDKQRLFGSL